jgi:4-aminobutyrate aminotransferase
MQALELVDDRESRRPAPRFARRLLEAARAEGLLIGIGGLHGHVIRIGPSLLVSEPEIDEGIARLEKACETVDS